MNTKTFNSVGLVALMAVNPDFALLSSDEIKKTQDGIHKTLVKLDINVHQNAIQCLAHAAEHGDTSLIRRLLVDTLGDSTGYRTQGLIQWMRLHSPCELKAKNVNLSGIIKSDAERTQLIKHFNEQSEVTGLAVDPDLFVVGERRPFMLAEATMADWKGANYAREQVKPLFQQSVLDPITAARKRIMTAMENTANGQPINPSKPFYDGKHGDSVVNFFDEVAKLQAKLPADTTQELRAAMLAVKENQAKVDSLMTSEDAPAEGGPNTGDGEQGDGTIVPQPELQTGT